MTREEAIRILSKRDAHGVLCGYTSGVTEALDMAIEALQWQDRILTQIEDIMLKGHGERGIYERK